MKAAGQYAVSVVVAAFSGRAALVRCLESLVPQAADADVIVAAVLPVETVAELQRRFPAVRFISAMIGTSVFRLRSLAIAEAVGGIVALTEDHCTISPDWIESHRRGHAADSHSKNDGKKVLGGPVACPEQAAVYGRALYLCEYASLMPSRASGPTDCLSGVNASYRRESLLSCRSVWQEAFYENEVHDALCAAGHTLYLQNDSAVTSHLTMGFGEALSHMFSGGNRFGQYRISRASPVQRLKWRLVGALVPFVLTARLLWTLIVRRPAKLWNFLAGFPWLACLLAVWSLGEWMGYFRACDAGCRESRVEGPEPEPESFPLSTLDPQPSTNP